MKIKNKGKPLKVIVLLSVLLFTTSACTSGVPANPSTEEDTLQQRDLATLQAQVQMLQKDLSDKEAERAALAQTLSLRETELAKVSQTVVQLEEDLAEAAATPVVSPGNPATATTASLLQTGMTIVQLLADEDMAALSSHVHPTLGVRFTAYPYVNPATDVVLGATQMGMAIAVPVQMNWGNQDGTGDPLLMDYATYHARYVYDADYANPEVIGIDTVIGYGNAIDNLTMVYPNARFLDFHFNGFDPQYDGMDWRSLRLVFELHNGDWKLVGVVHGEWTI